MVGARVAGRRSRHSSERNRKNHFNNVRFCCVVGARQPFFLIAIHAQEESCCLRWVETSTPFSISQFVRTQEFMSSIDLRATLIHRLEETAHRRGSSTQSDVRLERAHARSSFLDG